MKNYYPSYVTSPHKVFVKAMVVAKLASNLDAKGGLLILSDPRQHKKCVFFSFRNFHFTAPVKKTKNKISLKYYLLALSSMYPTN